MKTTARIHRLAIPLLALLAGLAVQATGASATETWDVSISFSRALPVLRPDTPVPDDPGQVFYLQRSTNRNTIIYAAQFDADGNLDPRNPLSVYWRRFEEDGQAQALTFEQRTFAFGVRVRPAPQPGEFIVRSRAAPRAQATLRQTGPFRAELVMDMDGAPIRLTYAFLEAIEGLVPRVLEVRAFGRHENGAIANLIARPR